MAETIKYYHNIDLIKNKIINSLLNPLTTSERVAMGATLTTSDKGYVVFDTSLSQQFFWDGSAWVGSGGGGGGSINAVTASSPLTATLGSAPNISTSVASGKLIGRASSGTGVMEEITLGTGLSFNGTTLNASAAVTPAALTKGSDDTNITITLGGSPNTALLQAASITVAWQGTLADGRIASANTWHGKQNALNGTGFVKASGTTISYDDSTYLTSAVTNIATSGLISGGTITSTGTISTSMSSNKLVGRYSTGTGVMQEITIGTGLSLSPTGTLTASGGSGEPTGFEQHFLLMGA